MNLFKRQLPLAIAFVFGITAIVLSFSPHQDARGVYKELVTWANLIYAFALLIGLIHGAAGSAGLLALAVAATREPWVAIGYVLVFGVGSILGMAALTFVAAWPLGAAERHAKWLHSGLSLGASALAILLGVEVMLETAGTAWGGV